MGDRRGVWVKVRVTEAERAKWHAKAAGARLTLSSLVRGAPPQTSAAHPRVPGGNVN